MMSSVMPSARRPVASSPPRLSKGSTAIDALAFAGSTGRIHQAPAPSKTRAATRAAAARRMPPAMLPQPQPPRLAAAVEPHAVGAHGPRNVLHLLLAGEVERQAKLALQVVVDGAGEQHAAGVAELLQPGGDVDAVAEQVVALDHHVAEIDADAEDDAALGRDIRLRGGRFLLQGDRAATRRRPRSRTRRWHRRPSA